jgi:hypothetical protein
MESNAEETPAPKKRKKAVGSSSITSDQLQQLLKEALSGYAQERTRKAADQANAIAATLEEFLNSFVLLGYDLDGTPITMVSTKTQQDADALSTAVTRFFMQHGQNRDL